MKGFSLPITIGVLIIIAALGYFLFQTINPQNTTPTVTILSAPASVLSGQTFIVSWRVDSYPATTNHTAVHFNVVHIPPSAISEGEYAMGTEILSGSIPGTFNSSIVLNIPDTYYFRAHVEVGGVNYWSEERTIVVQ